MLTAELNRTRKIGTEYEMTVPLVGSGSGTDVQQTLARVLTANGIRSIARGYSHDPLPSGYDLAVEYDNSVQGESRWEGIHWFPIEVKTRILNGIDDWELVVPKMLEISRYMGARVNSSCGHHVHLGFETDPTAVRSLWNLFHRFNDVVYGLVAPSRRHSTYCRPMPHESKLLHRANSVEKLRTALQGYDRYSALNLTHLFDDAPHIELRHHHGTLDVIKARNWLRFCLQLVQHSVNRTCQAAPAPLPNSRKNLEKLLVTIGLKVNTKVYAKVSPELRETGKYLLRTWKKFNGGISLAKSSMPQQGEEDSEDAACAA